MQNSRDDINFIRNIKKHPSKIISDNFKDGLENKNSSNEIIVVNKDISRNIFFQWKENDKGEIITGDWKEIKRGKVQQITTGSYQF